MQTRLSQEIIDILCCPICKSGLRHLNVQFECLNRDCGENFPVIDGIPVLINQKNSLFSPLQLVRQHKVMQVLQHLGKSPPKTKPGAFKCWTPNIGKNIKAKNNLRNFSELLLERFPSPKVLVIGGKTLGQGMEFFLGKKSITLIETDVFFSPRTSLICDSHDIPFIDQSLDGVVIQAVLEHVVNPFRCVEEIYRVLKDKGLVYAETAFMQQVHSGRYDFLRFTMLGHRRLFRNFEEIDSGAVCGPGMALAWSYQYFLLSLTKSRSIRTLLAAFSKFTSFYLKYFDYLIIDNPGSLDAASAYYFMGQRSNSTFSDQELLKIYRGAQI